LEGLAHDQVDRQKYNAQQENPNPPANPIHAALVGVGRDPNGDGCDDDKS
jgi:hypothetical protein